MKKEFDFIGHRRIFLFISLGIILAGIVCNIIFGIQLDISFKGGTLIKYSFEGELDENTVDAFVTDQLKRDVDIQFVSNEAGTLDTFSVSLTEDIDLDTQEALTKALQKAYPDQQITRQQANSLSPTMGHMFLIKCLVAIALASVFLIIYVALRFRKIGGWSAAVMALLALFNDLLIAYFTFVVFRIPLNDNFVAVLLSILGYSLNDTIVIYDRIRENKQIMDSKTPISVLVNTSLNQSFGRTFNTSLCTLFAIGTVAVIALILRLDSIVSFAVPMMMGVISGFYTSTCLCSPVWVLWVEHKEKKQAEKKAAAKKGSKKTAKAK